MIHTYIYIYFDVDPSKLYIVSWNDRDREWKKKKCAKEREIAVVETLTPSVFVLRHLFLNSLPLISTRRRPTFPLFNLLRSSVSRNNVSSPIEWRFFVLFFRLLCLSLSLDALVCRWGARVANSSHERDRLRQYRAAIVYRFRDPMLRNDVSKFRVLMCIILGLVSNEDNGLVYQWRRIRRIEYFAI